mgnify:CR=1 FL=1
MEDSLSLQFVSVNNGRPECLHDTRLNALRIYGMELLLFGRN